MNRKYFFFDIDGTLTEKESRVVVPSAVEAVHRLQKAGHFCSIATGRAFYKAIGFARENGFHNMVFFGGNGIYLNDTFIESRPLPRETALTLYHQAVGAGYGVLTAIDDSVKVYADSFLFYDQVGPRQEPTTYIIDENFDIDAVPDIYKMYIAVPKEEESRLPALRDIGQLRFAKEYLTIQPDNKRNGILRMLELTGGSPEDVIVFGDDTNDLVMFTEPFYRVAMGNAEEILKQHADYVTDRNVDDGIFNACLHHGWFD